MPPSTTASVPPGDDPLSQNIAPYKYDLRLEIGVKEEGTTVPVVAIFYDFVKHLKQAADADAPVAVLTATDKLFFENTDMPSDEFQKAFKVDNIEGKNAKVLLGFKIHTLTKLSELKRKLMHTYLIPHNLFLRQHAGGFENGVKAYSYGFLKDDHPDHPDISMLKQRYSRIVFESWQKLDKADKKKWRHELPNLFFGDTGIILPVNFTKERISATSPGNEKVTTIALMVSTPIKYGKLLKNLLDIALSTKRLNNLIPFALNRENVEGYYYMVAHQARFIENHRNIPILNIPPEANTLPGNKGATLSDVLQANPAVQRVSYDPQLNKYHISTISTRYRDLHQWITRVLTDHQFPYGPQIRPLRYGNSSSSITGCSYSDIFKEAMTQANDSFSSHPAPTTPRNPWKTRPPLAISYDINEAAFPALPRAKSSAPSTPSTASETIDEETIQSAISTAIQKLQEQHKQDLAQLKLEMQNQIDEVKNQMNDLGQQVATQTYQALVCKESPLTTKTDHAILQHDINIMRTQLSALMDMIQNAMIPTRDNDRDNHSVSTPPDIIHLPSTRAATRNVKRKPAQTPEKAPRQDTPFTQEQTVSSATSSSVASMEGCEE